MGTVPSDGRVGPFHMVFFGLVAAGVVGLAGSASAKKPGPPDAAPFCGNGVIEADRGEQCDGGNLGQQRCDTLGSGFTAGTLRCTGNCHFDTAACTTCGNGTVEAGEFCDGSVPASATCETEAFGGLNRPPDADFGTLACNATCDAYDTSACKRFVVDFLELTVTDRREGLMWQRTADIGRDNNTYTWSDGISDPNPNGTAFTGFLAGLNATADQPNTFRNCTIQFPGEEPRCDPPKCFAGHCDWRLPELHELETIVDSTQATPRIDQTAFGPTAEGFYWTATQMSLFCRPDSFSPGAFAVNFANGVSFCDVKSDDAHVRAVRSFNPPAEFR